MTSSRNVLRARGATLIEVLICFVLIAIACIASLSYFGNTRGFIGRTGNRRAALERARERLEQLMQVDPNTIKPSDFVEHTISCAGGTCTIPAPALEKVPVGGLPPQKIVSTIQCKHDPAAGTLGSTCDALEFSAKVWFTNDQTWPEAEDHRVHIRTLRAS